jgi:hypothetical protein
VEITEVIAVMLQCLQIVVKVRNRIDYVLSAVNR